MEVFDINGQIISPLAGKTLYVAGDSIAYGKGSAGGYGKCIADKYGMTLTNEAVDGATLTPNITDKVYGGTRGCISTVVTNSTALAKADYILLEGGVNDAWNNAPVGTLTDGFAAAYDETTMTGALEKMLDDLATNYSDKCVAYVFPHGGMFAGSENWYKTYKPAILAALKKWGVPYCWVSVKQFSKNDTATACQDWLRSTRLGRGSIKSHVRTVKVLGMGLFAFQERVHLLKGVTH